MQSFWLDLRYGARMLLKQPGFTFVAVVTLALGIGANTAVFSVVNSVLLRPLPYPEPERLLRVALADPQVEGRRGAYGTADFLAAQERNQSLAALAAFYAPGNGFSWAGREMPEQVSGALVTAQFFEVLQVKAARGRTFAPTEERPDAARVVVVSHLFWQQRLQADPNVIGQTLTLDGESYTVIGVMPPDFSFALTGTAEFWAALRLETPRFRPPYYLNVIGRLKPGVSAAQAQSDLNRLAAQVHEQIPGTLPKAQWSGRSRIPSLARLALFVLLSAVLFVLLIAAVNVANLLLGRVSYVTAIRQEVHALDAGLPLGRVSALDQVKWNALGEPCTYALLLGIFGGVALLLAALGIYGVMSYTIAQRTHEIGIRMALGAERTAILRLVVGQGMKLALAGTLVGLLGAFGLTRLMNNLLFGVSATDPATFVTIPALLVGVALLACWIPAWRATKVDPLVVLRYE
jgi:hypothetical protein